MCPLWLVTFCGIVVVAMPLRPSAGSGGTIGDGHDGVLAGLTAWLPVRDAAGGQCAVSAGGHQGPAGRGVLCCVLARSGCGPGMRPTLRSCMPSCMRTSRPGCGPIRARGGRSRPARPRRRMRSASPAMRWPCFPWWNWPAASWPARPCCGPSTCITGRLIWDCRCGPRSGAAAWARTQSWRCVRTGTGVRPTSRRHPPPRRAARRSPHLFFRARAARHADRRHPPGGRRQPVQRLQPLRRPAVAHRRLAGPHFRAPFRPRGQPGTGRRPPRCRCPRPGRRAPRMGSRP